MGFLSSILGGGSSSTKSGFKQLPKEAQQAYINATNQASSQLLGQAGQNAYAPLPQTASETQAYSLAQQPTTSTGLQSLISGYLNPFQSYLTQGINDQAENQYSLTKQALANSGQMGSNRDYLGAEQADQARLGAIGASLANNYNTAQATALNQNQQNINNLLQQGTNERSLNAQNNQSGITALQSLVGILSGYPNSSSSSGSQSNGIGGILSAFFGGK